MIKILILMFFYSQLSYGYALFLWIDMCADGFLIAKPSLGPMVSSAIDS